MSTVAVERVPGPVTAAPPVQATSVTPGPHLAFRFDAASCSGCKACQVACRDRNALPAGVQWRRVYEIVGGEWRQQGPAWVSDVFAYHLSMACNHCARPICAEVCPTGAMRQRPDGVVLVERDRCVGCGYCGWACPYGAPQLDPRSGTASKCTFCSDDIAAGREPACVAACPLRSLGVESTDTGDHDHAAGAALPPLPAPGLTRPALVVRPHAHAERARRDRRTRVANREELPARAGNGEPSLVAYTLLAQTAAGMSWTVLAAAALAGPLAPHATRVSLLGAALLLAGGAVASLAHLGRPLRAWRSLRNLRSSWLSREILLTAVFGAALLATALLAPRRAPALVPAALAGAALVRAMMRVYRLRTTPWWDRGSTTASFFGSALLLGAPAALLTGMLDAPVALRAAAAAALLGLAPLAVLHRRRFYQRIHQRQL